MNITMERWIFSGRNCMLSVLFSVLSLGQSEPLIALHQIETRSSNSVIQPTPTQPVWGDCLSLIACLACHLGRMECFFVVFTARICHSGLFLHLFTYSSILISEFDSARTEQSEVRTVSLVCDAALASCNCIWLFSRAVKELFFFPLFSALEKYLCQSAGMSEHPQSSDFAKPQLWWQVFLGFYLLNGLWGTLKLQMVETVSANVWIP